MSAKDQVVDVVAAVQQGYAFDGPALELGALVVDGTARPDAAVRIPLAMVNRHGLVAGATGTGKTKTLQLMAEQLSAAGVPVMAADIKGDLSGLAEPGEATERTTTRATEVGQAWSGAGLPGRAARARRRGRGHRAARDDDVVRPDAAREGARPQRGAGVVAGPGVPLRRQGRAADARPQGPARGRAVPHQRRGQGRAQGARRAVPGDGRGDPARADRVRGPGRGRLLRRAGVRHRRPDAGRPPRAAASCRCSSCRSCRTGRGCSRRS